MSDESFRAELRAWLAANITDEFREKRQMKRWLALKPPPQRM